MDLSVQDVHDFVNEINVVRERTGLDPLTEIEFDACDPNNGLACLSALNLYGPLGFAVGTYTVRPTTLLGRRDERLSESQLAETLGVEVHAGAFPGVPIPEAILKVTSVFDSADEHYPEDVLRPLRALFVEAGYVD